MREQACRGALARAFAAEYGREIPRPVRPKTAEPTAEFRWKSFAPARGGVMPPLCNCLLVVEWWCRRRESYRSALALADSRLSAVGRFGTMGRAGSW